PWTPRSRSSPLSPSSLSPLYRSSACPQPPARRSFLLSVATKRHADRHAETKKRHADITKHTRASHRASHGCHKEDRAAKCVTQAVTWAKRAHEIADGAFSSASFSTTPSIGIG